MSMLRISIGIIYLWFGVLKFFPDISPAETLAKDTIEVLTLGLIPRDFSFLMLAVGEFAIGTMLVLGIWKRYTFYLALSHMFCTFLPLVLLPNYSFNDTPFTLTLVGQYIMKNVVIVSALFVVYRSYVDFSRLKRLMPI